MKLAFFLNRLNHHQVHVADELCALLGDDYKFIELCKPNEGSKKGDATDYSSKPYIIQTWKGDYELSKAKQVALTFDACVFGTIDSLPFQKLRLNENKLSFEVSERWLKKGIINILSPRLLKNYLYYLVYGWSSKPLYKLCSSAFSASDHRKLSMYRNKCYKWGYFTKVEERFTLEDIIYDGHLPIRLMWCARFLKLKHPELPVQMAARLKKEGYSFILDYYGNGEEYEPTRKLAEKLQVCDVVKFHGSLPNKNVLEAMRQHDVFLFTSNRLEGWGAVVNESMSNGCAVVGSDAIGSVPYLVRDRISGFRFKSGDVDSLYEKVKWLLEHPVELQQMQQNAVSMMKEVWSPKNAAKSLLILIQCLMQGIECPIHEGPCSKA